MLCAGLGPPGTVLGDQTVGFECQYLQGSARLWMQNREQLGTCSNKP